MPLWHDDFIKGKHFPRYWPFVRGIHRCFDVYFDLRPNKQLSKQSWGWWFETSSRPLWRHHNGSLCIRTTHALLYLIVVGIWTTLSISIKDSSFDYSTDRESTLKDMGKIGRHLFKLWYHEACDYRLTFDHVYNTDNDDDTQSNHLGNGEDWMYERAKAGTDAICCR